MKTVKAILICFVLMAGAMSMLAQNATEFSNLVPNNPKLIKGKLDNGLQYFILKNNYPQNRAELSIVVKAGAVNEDDDQLGLAHFCEHMAFNGTKNYPKHDLVSYLESIGMKFGAEVNAFTSFDETVYGITVPLDSVKILDKGLQVLYDWGQLVSFENEEIDKERGVIHEEWRMGQGAQDRMMKKMLPVIFHKSKYADRLPIGKMEIIDKCPYDALKRFYKDWYRPDNMGIIVVGDFDEKVMEKKIKDLFAKMPKVNNPRKKESYDIPDHSETLVAVITDKESPATSAQIFYKHPKFVVKTIADYRVSMMHNLFNSMLNKRLGELAILPDPPFVQGMGFYTEFLGPRDILISVAVTKNEGLEKGLMSILVENERVKKFGFTATELEREKKSIMKEIEKQFNEKDKIKSQNLLTDIRKGFLNDAPVSAIEDDYALYKKYLDGITLDEVNKVAVNLISDKNQVIIISAPEKEGIKVPSEDKVKEIVAEAKKQNITAYVDKVINKPLVAKDPTAGTIEKKSTNAKLGTTEWQLSNGVKVVIKQTDFKKDEILMSAYSNGGYSLNENTDLVSAQLACDVITESGVGDFDKTELEKYLSDKVANVNPYIREIEEGMDGSCSPKDFETMMQLTYLYFTAPRKDESAFTSYINKQKAMLENKNTNPEMAFRDTVTSVLTNNHPRKRPLSVDMLKEASFKRIHYLYKQRFGDPTSFTFYFVGNIDPKTAEPMILKYLGGLPKVERTESWKDNGITGIKGKVDKNVFKGKEPKSMVFMGISGDFDYNVKNKINFDVLTAILQIKLIESIREDKSGVYTIGAIPQITHYPKGKFNLIVFFPCSPDNIENLSAGVLTEMKKLQDNGPTDVDLNKAKEQALRERETDAKENAFWLKSLKDIGFDNDDPNTSIFGYENYVKGLTKENMKEAAKKYFSLENYARVSLKPEP